MIVAKGIKLERVPDLSLTQKEEVLRIWNAEYPVSLNYTSEQFEEYLFTLEDKHHILVMDAITNKVLGWYQDFLRDEERWFALLIHRSFQGLGLGKRIMEEAFVSNKKLSGWVVVRTDYVKFDGSPYVSPLSFYEKLGFEVLRDVQLNTTRLQAIKIRKSIW